MKRDKIKSLDELVDVVEEKRREGKKIVHCHGNFDLVHPGHIKHFEEAKKLGDYLVVTITEDRFIQKGPGRPYFNQDLRAMNLAALEDIDFVAINNAPTAVPVIERLRPDFYVKGKEVLGNKDIDAVMDENGKKSNLALEKEAVEKYGGKLHLTDEVSFSTTKIINEITSSISDEAKEFLGRVREKYDIPSVLGYLDGVKNTRVLVIGDAIFDRYFYCESMEKSGKEAQIAYKEVGVEEIHAGGVFAVANHLAGFVDNLTLLTSKGGDNEEFIEQALNPKIKRNIFNQEGEKTMVKTRFVEQYRNRKVFHLYNQEELKINEENEKRVLEYLENHRGEFDLIVVSDFGHGMLSPEIVDYLSRCSGKPIAVNCQLNAGNNSNFVTKYSRADFVSINERELRIPFQRRKEDIEVPIRDLFMHLKANKINVTLGKNGSVYYCNGKICKAPSFTTEVKDTIGSGDAVFALTSLLAYQNAPPEILGYLGNSIGGLAVKIVGNRSAVDPMELRKFVSYTMK